jgi:hypothetical protein
MKGPKAVRGSSSHNNVYILTIFKRLKSHIMPNFKPAEIILPARYRIKIISLNLLYVTRRFIVIFTYLLISAST